MINSVTLIGNLGTDPEYHQLPSGTPAVRFVLAVNEHWNDKETSEKVTRTHWFRVVGFGRLS